MDRYGQLVSHPMGKCMPRVAKTGPSSCGSSARILMGFGSDVIASALVGRSDGDKVHCHREKTALAFRDTSINGLTKEKNRSFA